MMTQRPLDFEAARSALSQLDNEGASRLANDLRDMAFHMSSRIHYTESRLSTMAGLGGGLIAFGTAILSLISALGDKVSLLLRVAVLLFSISSILSGLVVWFIYARQTNFSYAFKGVPGPRTWFYRDAIPTSDTFTIPPSAYFGGGVRADKASAHILEEFSTQWSGFATHVGSVFGSPIEHALENLQQVYLLHYNEFYKNRFLTQLRTVLRSLIQWVLVPELAFLVFVATFELVT
jgi:hypothetical protein